MADERKGRTREQVEVVLDSYAEFCPRHQLGGIRVDGIYHGPHEPLGVLSTVPSNSMVMLFRTAAGEPINMQRMGPRDRDCLGGVRGSLCVCRHCGGVYFQHGTVEL